MKLIDRETIQLTEIESILFAIGMGVSDGSEFTTKVWKERECFKNNSGSHKKHITNLECCTKELLIEGKGKRKLYTLKGYYLTPQKRHDGRISNGYKHSDDELILDEYVFNYLLRCEYKQALPYKSWSYRIGFFPMDILKQKNIINEMNEVLDNLHHKTIQYTQHDRQRFINIFVDAIKTRGIDVIEKAFNRLEQAGRIVVENRYMANVEKNKYKEIALEEYEQLIIEENIILEEEGLDRKEYIYKKINKNHRDKDYYDISKKIYSHMKYKYGIRYYYIAKLPIVLDRDRQVPSEVDGKASFYNRFFFLTDSRQNSYIDSYDTSKIWYLVNTYSLLKIFGVDVPEDRYNAELKKLEVSYVNAFEFKEEVRVDVENNLPNNF